MSTVKQPELPLDTTVGGYHLVNRVGLGAHGVVYRARREKTGREVALKVLRVSESAGGETLERFSREAQTLSRISHPNVIRYEDSGVLVWQGTRLPFLAMEFLDGLQTLDGAVAHHPPEWALDRVEELLEALICLHHYADPIVHRDLKPANLGVGKDGRLRVLDLGLARTSNSRLTAPSTTMGSLGYIAPEQLKDSREVDTRADLYSTGMIVLEVLGGANPMRLLKPYDAIRAIMDGRIPSPPRELPGPLEAWCRRMTARNPEERPPDADTALQDLRRARTQVGPLPPFDVEAAERTPTWNTIVSVLGNRMRRIDSGCGCSLLLIGPGEWLRETLMGLAVGYAQNRSMTVLHADCIPALAEQLGCETDADSIYFQLTTLAEENPTLVVFEIFSEKDVVFTRLIDLVAVSPVPLILLACGPAAPENTRGTIVPVED
ncbi:MAG: serine/threonine-protein kinase [Candidatus Xenobia bacterium]